MNGRESFNVKVSKFLTLLPPPCRPHTEDQDHHQHYDNQCQDSEASACITKISWWGLSLVVSFRRVWRPVIDPMAAFRSIDDPLKRPAAVFAGVHSSLLTVRQQKAPGVQALQRGKGEPPFRRLNTGTTHEMNQATTRDPSAASSNGGKVNTEPVSKISGLYLCR